MATAKKTTAKPKPQPQVYTKVCLTDDRGRGFTVGDVRAFLASAEKIGATDANRFEFEYDYIEITVGA